MPSKLHITKIKSALPTRKKLFFLHGIMGRGRNWQRFATDLLKKDPGLEAFLVDLRLHGDSQNFLPPHTVEACGQDVLEIIRDEIKSEKPVLIGHSFGGKVALEVLSHAPHSLSEVWLIDSFPGLSVKQGDAWKMIVWLQKNPGPFSSRAEVLALLKKEKLSEAIATWMATNLIPENSLWNWIFPVEGIAQLLEDYALTDLTSVLLDPTCPIHVVKGTKSPLITDDLIQKIKNSRSRFPISLHVIEAGHWIHSENPKALLELMASAL